VAAVELALLMPVLLLIFFGIAGLGRVYVVDLALAHAARAGMQYALASNTRDVALIAAAARRDALPDLPGMPLPAVAIVQRCADGSPYGGSGPARAPPVRRGPTWKCMPATSWGPPSCPCCPSFPAAAAAAKRRRAPQ
jgi:hypothetical protein